MDQHTVLIISEHKTDHLILSACLERAAPARFRLASPNLMRRPLEALLDPAIDAVIMANGPETEYLLRLAQKNNATAPIILLLDEVSEKISAQLRDYGAQDYLVRGQLQDQLVHRILDYSIQLKEARDQIRQLSNRDALTGALNRAGFRAHLERAMDRSERYGFNTALLYINVDQFANVNDNYGEADGDLMIKTISRRLINKMRSTDSIARLGGDEFAVVLEDVNSSADVELIAEKMLGSISAPMILSEQQVSVEASIGAAIYPEDGSEFSDLVDNARSAMQQAKSVAGGRFIRYSEQLLFDVAGGQLAGGRTANRGAQEPVRTALPAQDRPERRPAGGTGGTAALEPPRAGPALPGGIPLRLRRHGADENHRLPGDTARLFSADLAAMSRVCATSMWQ